MAGAYYNRAIAYYQLNKYDLTWEDVHQAQALGAAVNPNFINALQEKSGQYR